MTFDDALREVKQNISCMNYLHKAPRGGLCCPFCGSGTGPNKTGALEYYKDTNTFTCHACNRSGDVIDLYMNDTGHTFRDSVRELAFSVGISIDGSDSSKRRSGPLRGSQSDFKVSRDNLSSKTVKTEIGGNMDAKKANIKDRFKEYCERCQADVDKTDFFHRRGLSDAVITHNSLGYDAGKDAVVFPYNKDYTYIQARRVNPKEGERKYIKPKEADAGGKEPVYKAEALYRMAPCFVCEGALDALAIQEAGGNGCALGGGGVNKLISQLQERWPISPIILCFDTGKQGQADTESASQKLDALGIPFTMASFNLARYGLEAQEDVDPNDLLLANREQFQADIKANEEKARPVSDVSRFMAECYTEKFKPIPTGLDPLDRLLDGGVMRQTLNILMAEAGTGKTTLMSIIMENLAKTGYPCLYINLEMSTAQLMARALSRMCLKEFNAQIPVRKILRGYEQTESEKATVEKAARRYNKQIGSYLRYNPGNTGAELSAILEYISAIGGNAAANGLQAPAICLDYLHLLAADKGETGQDMIKRAVAGLKDYAERYDSIVFLISAQNRDKSEKKEPSLSAGRDSSAIEYSGDLIVQLIRDEAGTGDNNRISLHVVKSRFTECDKYKHLDFTLCGDYADMVPDGDWIQGSAGEIPFDGAITRDGTYKGTV